MKTHWTQKIKDENQALRKELDKFKTIAIKLSKKIPLETHESIDLAAVRIQDSITKALDYSLFAGGCRKEVSSYEIKRMSDDVVRF